MNLQDRRFRIVRLLGQIRVAIFPMLLDEFPPDSKRVATNKSGGKPSGQYLQNTVLPSLAKEGHIIITKGEPTIYTLGDLGAKLLTEHGIQFYGSGGEGRREITNWKKHAKDIERGFKPEGQSPHLLQRAEFQMRLRRTGITIDDWLHDGEAIYMVKVPTERGYVDYKMIPDDGVCTGLRIVYHEAELNMKSADRNEKILGLYYFWANRDYKKLFGQNVEMRYIFTFPTVKMREEMRERVKKVLAKELRPYPAMLFNFLTLEDDFSCVFT